MPKPTLTSGLLSATVVWNMYGFATGFFERAWGRAPIPVTPISYALNAAIVVALPFSRDRSERALLTSTVLGALMAAWSAAGVIYTPRGVRLGRLPGAAGAGAPMVLGLLASLSGYRAYRDRSGRRGTTGEQGPVPSEEDLLKRHTG